MGRVLMGVYTSADRPRRLVHNRRTGCYHAGDNLDQLARRVYGPTARVKIPVDPARRDQRIVYWTSLDGYLMTEIWEVIR